MAASSSKRKSYNLREVLGKDVNIKIDEKPGKQRPKFKLGLIIAYEIKFHKKPQPNEVRHYIKFKDGRDDVWVNLAHLESIGCLKWPREDNNDDNIEITPTTTSSSGCGPDVSDSDSNDASKSQDEEEEDAMSVDTDSDTSDSSLEVEEEEEEDLEEEEASSDKSASAGRSLKDSNDVEATTSTSISSRECCSKVSADSYAIYKSKSQDTDTELQWVEEGDDSNSSSEEEEDDESEEEQQESTNKNESVVRNERRPRTWDEAFESVKSFYQENGHTDDPGIKAWINVQRKRKRKLSSQKIQKLDSINFDWETRAEKSDKQWNKMFDLIKEYKSQNGNTRVPKKVRVDGENLGRWVDTQMKRYRQKLIRSDRKKRLESIEFEWYRDESRRWPEDRVSMGKHDVVWYKKFRILKEYKDQHGDTLVPCDCEYGDIDGVTFRLGIWVKNQRWDFRNGTLKKSRQKQLESIDFEFQVDLSNSDLNKSQGNWDEMFERLKEYKMETGHCRVPRNYDDPRDSELPASLGVWVDSQRHRLPKHEIRPIRQERRRRLESIGFEFRIEK